MELSPEKCLVMSLLTMISIILGLIPYFIIRYTKSSLRLDSTLYQLLLTFLSCFGAGILLATAVLHVLPEVRSRSLHVSELWDTFDQHFPVSEMLVLCGFCLIYLVEEVAHFIMVDGHHHGHLHANTIGRHNSINYGLQIPKSSSSTTTSITMSISGDIPSNNNKLSNSITAGLGLKDIESSTATSSQQEDERLEKECQNEKSRMTSSLRSAFALIALSFHEIVEGIAIGIQNSTDVWIMFGGIGSHKFVISFCMGIELLTSKASITTYVGSIIFFSIVSPIGIAIGSAIASSTASTLAVVIIQGVVCGTLLYVVFFEILNRERERKSYSMPNTKAVGFLQFIALVIGLVAMGCLSTLTHSHDEEESGFDDHPHLI